jgi:rod shape-determining protein MreB and related proteins
VFSALIGDLGGTVYIRLSPDRLSVRDPRAQREIAGVPEIAIDLSGKHARVVAVGDEARSAIGVSVRIERPFGHPRSLFSDFTLGEQLVRTFIRMLFGKKLFAPNPIAIVHPQVNPEGGFTQIEFRVMKELLIGAGASQVYIWLGRPLSDDDLLQKRYLTEPGLVAE